MTVVEDDLEIMLDHDDTGRECQLVYRPTEDDPWQDCDHPAAWIFRVRYVCDHAGASTVLVCQRCYDDILNADPESDEVSLIACGIGGCEYAAEITSVEPLR